MRLAAVGLWGHLQVGKVDLLLKVEGYSSLVVAACWSLGLELLDLLDDCEWTLPWLLLSRPEHQDIRRQGKVVEGPSLFEAHRSRR